MTANQMLEMIVEQNIQELGLTISFRENCTFRHKLDIFQVFSVR